MREIDPTRVWLTKPLSNYTRDQVLEMAISLYEIGQQSTITISSQMRVMDGCLRVYAARKLKRGFLTFHRGLKPRLYRNPDFVLTANIVSDIQF